MRVVELFAGVGGFRYALERECGGFNVVWSNQYEPPAKDGKERRQHASACYTRNFGNESHSNVDINDVEPASVPDHDLLVGGFPCQDYSTPMIRRSRGIHGRKGRLWFNIEDIISVKKPPYILLENVDRLLRSPAKKRGRDFAVILASLSQRGYVVEWRVLNAADYGFAQRRRRLFIFAARKDTPWGKNALEHVTQSDFLRRRGFFARAFPVREPVVTELHTESEDVRIEGDSSQISKKFSFAFENAGICCQRKVWARRVEANQEPFTPMLDILEKSGVPEEYFVTEAERKKWETVKGAKSKIRTTAEGFTYSWSEGAIPFPDSTDRPSRTMMTTEGGKTPIRTSHVVTDPETGRLRRLTPEEAERLNGFPAGWTSGMPRGWRYFSMGNALVVGLITRMGKTLLKVDPTDAAQSSAPVTTDICVIPPSQRKS